MAPRALTSLLRCWPTWLALGWAAFTLSDVGDGTEFAFLLVLAAVGYLTVAVLERPRATWPLLFLLLGVFVALRVSGIDERVVVVASGAVVVAFGLVGGPLRRPGPPSLQVPAAGLTAHAAWDAYHWWADRIVVRSFAEWCGVLDLTLGVGILVLV